jgi:hypothetical protein
MIAVVLSGRRCPSLRTESFRLYGQSAAGKSRASEIKELTLGKLKGTLVDFNQLEHVPDDAPPSGAWQLEPIQRTQTCVEFENGRHSSGCTTRSAAQSGGLKIGMQ